MYAAYHYGNVSLLPNHLKSLEILLLFELCLSYAFSLDCKQAIIQRDVQQKLPQK